ncbi:MAG: ribokinase [Bacteroidetes bacterium]|nr:ribokinase [Bacteroidota bacterium]
MNEKIVVIGSSNVDLIMKMERIPQIGETVTGGKFSQVFGGKGANQAVAAARAGGEVHFISCLGNDAFGPDILENFKKDNIHTEYVFTDLETPTGTALIMIDQQGRNCISVASGANYRLTESHIQKALPVIKKASIIVLQCEIHPETLKSILNISDKLGKEVMLNLAPAIPLEDKYLNKVSWLIVNETEAALLSGEKVNNLSSAMHAASLLLPKVKNGIIVTLGIDGSFVLSKDLQARVPVHKVEAVDSTAAGDVYCGSLAVAIVEKKPIREAVRFASAASAISVTRLGAQPSAPFRHEIEAFTDRK